MAEHDRPTFTKGGTSVDGFGTGGDVLSKERGSISMRPDRVARGGGRSRRMATETRIILVGKTGSGKSCTGNTILGKPQAFRSEAGAQSITKQCQYSSCKYEGRTVVVIDTPGLLDTDMTEEEVKTEIVKCLALASPGPHAILVVIPANVRYTKECQETTNHYLQLFSDKVTDYVLPVFTKIDQFHDDLITEKRFLKNLDRRLNDFLQKVQNRYVFVNNRNGDKETERRKIFAAIETMLDSYSKKCFTNKQFETMENELQKKEDSSDMIASLTRTQSSLSEESMESADSLPTNTPPSKTSMEQEDSRRPSTRQRVKDDDGFLGRLTQLFSDFFNSFFELLRGKKS